MIEKALIGGRKYWYWIAFLLIVIGVGAYFYTRQLDYGLGITGMSSNVSWGLYIANFTFSVGVAASAVTLVLPYYLHNYKEFRHIIILGEFLAVAAILMAVLFIVVDLGQVSRVFNILLHPSPTSLIFWDVVALSVYLLLNLIIAWSTLDAEAKSEPPLRWIRPLIIVSIPWAICIHTVTAFIYAGLGARPFWLTALMAPRFLASAFASGPAFLLLIILVLKRTTGFIAGDNALNKVSRIVTYALIANLFFLVVEIFTVFYSGVPDVVQHFQYLLFGLQGNYALVPWMWTSIAFGLLSLVFFINPGTRQNEKWLAVACVFAFVSVWLDKGLGLIEPGFIPSQTGQIFAYVPTLPEILITAGVWSIGLMVITVLYKTAVSVKKEFGITIK